MNRSLIDAIEFVIVIIVTPLVWLVIAFAWCWAWINGDLPKKPDMSAKDWRVV